MAQRKSTAKTGGKIDPVDGWTINLAAATGTNARSLQQRLISQLIQTLWLPDDLSEDAKFKRIKSAIAAMEGIKPEDEIEGLLAVQMVATHNAAMECLTRAMYEYGTAEFCDQSHKQATKLLSLYMRQFGALDKRRTMGKHIVTFEYVNVEPGGQAIVEPGESGEPERSRKSQNPANEPAPVVPLETLNEQPAADKTATAKKRR